MDEKRLERLAAPGAVRRPQERATEAVTTRLRALAGPTKVKAKRSTAGKERVIRLAGPRAGTRKVQPARD